MKRKNKSRGISDKVYYWAMILPALVLTFMFGTMTLPGILIAFEDYIPTLGWFGSDWVGLDNFKIFFMQPDAWRIIRNTLVIAVGKLVLTPIVAITYALMINEVRNPKLKKGLQTCTYLTHFISWVIYATIIKSVLGTNGLINNTIVNLGGEKIGFLTTPEVFPIVLIVTEIIKGFGWNAIIYLSGLSGIDPGLYEAAEMDGANRWQQTWHVTLPGLRPVIVIVVVLSLGSILNAGFDQVLNMQNQLVMSTGDIIDTWVYRQGIVLLNYGVSSAVGLLNSMIALTLTAFAYWFAYKFADYKIF